MWVKLFTKHVIITYAFGSQIHEKVDVWIKSVLKSIEIPGRARREEWLSRSKLKQAFLIDSDAELFII